MTLSICPISFYNEPKNPGGPTLRPKLPKKGERSLEDTGAESGFPGRHQPFYPFELENRVRTAKTFNFFKKVLAKERKMCYSKRVR